MSGEIVGPYRNPEAGNAWKAAGLDQTPLVVACDGDSVVLCGGKPRVGWSRISVMASRHGAPTVRRKSAWSWPLVPTSAEISLSSGSMARCGDGNDDGLAQSAVTAAVGLPTRGSS